MKNSNALRELIRELWLITSCITIGYALSIILAVAPTLSIAQVIGGIGTAGSFLVVSFVRAGLPLDNERKQRISVSDKEM